MNSTDQKLKEAIAMCQSMNHPGDDEDDLMNILATVSRRQDLPWQTLHDAWNQLYGQTTETTGPNLI